MNKFSTYHVLNTSFEYISVDLDFNFFSLRFSKFTCQLVFNNFGYSSDIFVDIERSLVVGDQTNSLIAHLQSCLCLYRFCILRNSHFTKCLPSFFLSAMLEIYISKNWANFKIKSLLTTSVFCNFKILQHPLLACANERATHLWNI